MPSIVLSVIRLHDRYNRPNTNIPLWMLDNDELGIVLIMTNNAWGCTMAIVV